ncbi:hypothetical protein PXO_01206 [Xanthomonas oryzae pv. oryzae PXO99A]|uniref:Uncharacterized protein n=1 Tax=Xanthomonas oryzae pv. oryzae (strain PXO99A) TaxID=360094 RepID=A0A0K0GLH2_XANOP|nr:hypothetical protein PXO_01206 [Xanthomonas oryzae pv. oryzae PXO99A]
MPAALPAAARDADFAAQAGRYIAPRPRSPVAVPASCNLRSDNAYWR